MSLAAVFLDRDGVLNETVMSDSISRPPADAESLVFFPEVGLSLKRLRERGYLLICVTNQPDVARGTRTAANVAEMNWAVKTGLKLDALYCCMHDNSDNCVCRKPKPGMLLAAAQEFNIDLTRSWMIGDRSTDVLAGIRAGCHTILLNRQQLESTCNADFIAADLDEASQHILSTSDLE